MKYVTIILLAIISFAAMHYFSAKLCVDAIASLEAEEEKEHPMAAHWAKLHDTRTRIIIVTSLMDQMHVHLARADEAIARGDRAMAAYSLALADGLMAESLKY